MHSLVEPQKREKKKRERYPKLLGLSRLSRPRCCYTNVVEKEKKATKKVDVAVSPARRRRSSFSSQKKISSQQHLNFSNKSLSFFSFSLYVFRVLYGREATFQRDDDSLTNGNHHHLGTTSSSVWTTTT